MGEVEPLTPERTFADFAVDLAAIAAEASSGPFLWGPTDDAAAFLAEAARRTDEHGDAQPQSWVVQTTDPDDPVTVAFSGNGPRAHRNAELIAFLLNNVSGLLDDARATQSEPSRLREARHAIVQADIYLANDDPVSAHSEIERAHAALTGDADTPTGYVPGMTFGTGGNRLSSPIPSGSDLTAALDRIMDDARWLQEHSPDYTPDGVATLRDIAREIEKEAHALSASSASSPGLDES